MYKKLVVSNLANLFLLTVIYGFYGCFSIQPVQINGVDDFRVTSLLSQPEIKLNLEVKNPNRFGIKVKRIEMFIYLGDSILSDVDIPAGYRILGNSQMEIPITFKPSVSALSSLAFGGVQSFFSNQTSKSISVKGDIVIQKFIFSKKIKISESVKF